INVSRQWLWLFSDDFIPYTRGVCFPAHIHPDRLLVLLAKYPRMVVGLTTALWMHGALVRRPNEDWIVHGLKAQEPVRYPFTVLLRTTWPLEHTEEKVWHGVTFRLQTPARAAVDCVRFRQRLGP